MDDAAGVGQAVIVVKEEVEEMNLRAAGPFSRRLGGLPKVSQRLRGVVRLWPVVRLGPAIHLRRGGNHYVAVDPRQLVVLEENR